MEQNTKKNRPSLFLPFIALFFLFIPSVHAAGPISETAVYPAAALVITGIIVFCLLIGLGAQIPFFTIIGFFLVFVMGFIIQGGNLYLPSGEIAYVYGDNYSGYHYDDYNGTIKNYDEMALFHEFKEYEPWNSGNYHFIGWFLMMAGLFATIFSVFATFGGRE